MINKFRSCYPNAGLISELIKIDCGKYIVRAIVVQDGITLASGLAAAETIEVAEDKARERAISLLNLSLTSISPQSGFFNQQVNGMEETKAKRSPIVKDNRPSSIEDKENDSPKQITEPEITQEMIQESSIHLARVGWTNQQGRDYLTQV